MVIMSASIRPVTLRRAVDVPLLEKVKIALRFPGLGTLLAKTGNAEVMIISWILYMHLMKNLQSIHASLVTLALPMGSRALPYKILYMSSNI